MASELAEASILQLSVIGRYLGVDVDAIRHKCLDMEAEELLSAVTNMLEGWKRSQIELPVGLKSYCKRRSILLEC